MPSLPPPSLAQLADDGILAIGAGSETTAGALTNLFVCLLAFPDVLARLQAEVDQFYPPEADSLDTSPHPKMPYLDAVMYVACCSMQLADSDGSR